MKACTAQCIRLAAHAAAADPALQAHQVTTSSCCCYGAYPDHHVALKKGPAIRCTDTSTEDIPTDSLGSMRAMSKAINRPHDVAEHRHQLALHSVIHETQASTATVHNWNVEHEESCIQHVGNAQAGAAACGQGIPWRAHRLPSLRPAQNNLCDIMNMMYWPIQVHTTVGHDAADGATPTHYRPVTDLTGRTKRCCSHLSKALERQHEWHMCQQLAKPTRCNSTPAQPLVFDKRNPLHT